MPKSVSYQTKIVDVKAVSFAGQLEHREIVPGDRDMGYAWFIGKDNLEEWFEKLEDKHLYLDIRVGGKDESHMLGDEDA